MRRCREHEAAGRGKFDAEGVFVFVRHVERVTARAPRVNIGRVVSCEVDQYHGGESSQSGFLRYPLPWGVSTAPKFPGLFKVGAGLL